jgi:NADH-quinone oxidoreductase subunit E
LAQKEFGHISNEVMKYVASLLSLSPAEVYDTVSFYFMFHTKPVGKNVIYVCHTLSCSIMGAKNIVKHIEDKLGVKVGETTSDGKFTLKKAECLGSCGTAPMMQVNDDYHENLTLEKVDRILESLK